MELPLTLLVLVAVTLTFPALISSAEVCYGELGCFHTHGSMHSLPASPQTIATSFTLAVRGDNHAAVLWALDTPFSWHLVAAGGGYNVTKETKIITHGYNDGGTTDWIVRMTSELLKKGDYNVFVTDWGNGARGLYGQATANSLLVAGQLAQLVKALGAWGQDLATVHLIGHSLGAHISGNAGSKCPGLGRISAMDPAEPFFKSDFNDTQRLDKSDAVFVDVIHTDGADFNLLQGYGLKDPVGHMDFYPNGGVDQPGCTDSATGGIFGFGGGGDSSIGCSHGRSHDYYIESINSVCRFLAHPCAGWADYEKGLCHGCPETGCPQMGFNADNTFAATGSYYVSTAQSSPYCGDEYFVEMDLTGEHVNSFGRIYLTFLGQTRNSREIEFTRESRRYHARDKESHMVALHTAVGSVTGVKVRFHRGDGLPALGTAHHITVHNITVEDAATKHRTTFCTHDHILPDDRTETFRSTSGC